MTVKELQNLKSPKIYFDSKYVPTIYERQILAHLLDIQEKIAKQQKLVQELEHSIYWRFIRDREGK